MSVIIFVIFIIIYILFINDISVEDESSYKCEIIYVNNGIEESMDIESYIIGVLASNISINYSMETMKAMSVVYRSYIMDYILDKLEYIEGENIIIYAEELELSYIDVEGLRATLGDEIYEENVKKYEEAVNMTEGQVIMCDGQIITPLFHVANTGITRNSYDALGIDIEYLRSVDSNLDIEYEEALQIKDYKKDDFKKKIEILSRDMAGYVLRVKVDGNEMSGEECAKEMRFASSAFYISEEEDKVRVICKGKGHGLGLSIFGSEKMSENGSKYTDIIKHYYTGVKLAKIK